MRIGYEESFTKEDFSSLSQIIEYLDTRYSMLRAKYSLNIGIASSSKVLEDLKVKSTLEYRGLVYNIHKKDDNLYKAKIGKKTIILYYIIRNGKSKDEKSSYYLFLSDDNRSRQVFLTFIRNSKPYFETGLLYQKNIFDILDAFEEKYGELKFVEGTLRSPFKTQRIWNKRPIIYNRVQLENMAKEVDGRWSSLVIQSDVNNIRFRIYEDGWITLYHGSLKLLMEDILKPVLRMIDFNRLMFKEVEDNAPNDESLKILRFESDEPFTKDVLLRVRDELAGKYIISVIHAGNPYLHIDIVDKKDYSSLTLFATDNVIELIPGRKISSATLIEITSILLNIFPTLKIRVVMQHC